MAALLSLLSLLPFGVWLIVLGWAVGLLADLLPPGLRTVVRVGGTVVILVGAGDLWRDAMIHAPASLKSKIPTWVANL